MQSTSELQSGTVRSTEGAAGNPRLSRLLGAVSELKPPWTEHQLAAAVQGDITPAGRE